METDRSGRIPFATCSIKLERVIGLNKNEARKPKGNLLRICKGWGKRGDFLGPSPKRHLGGKKGKRRSELNRARSWPLDLSSTGAIGEDCCEKGFTLFGQNSIGEKGGRLRKSESVEGIE